MVSNYVPLSTLSYVAMTSISAGGRAYLPVDTKQVVYSHFQYVSGVPRTKDQNGVSIGKLKILNTLIDQLVKMRENEQENTLSKNIGYASSLPESAYLLDLTA